jgi:hypothetical protein
MRRSAETPLRRSRRLVSSKSDEDGSQRRRRKWAGVTRDGWKAAACDGGRSGEKRRRAVAVQDAGAWCDDFRNARSVWSAPVLWRFGRAYGAARRRRRRRRTRRAEVKRRRKRSAGGNGRVRGRRDGKPTKAKAFEGFNFCVRLLASPCRIADPTRAAWQWPHFEDLCRSNAPSHNLFRASILSPRRASDECWRNYFFQHEG